MVNSLLDDLGKGDFSLIVGGKLPLPEIVKGRVGQLDADFLAYIATNEKKDALIPKSFNDCKQQLNELIEELRLMAGAETIQLHVTPSYSNKGGRNELAIQKEYQANRDGKEKPKYLHELRQYMIDYMGAVSSVNLEADDTMAMFQHKAVSTGNKDKSIIITKDKDLRMVEGLHLNWDTGEIVDTDVTGWLEMKETSSGKSKLHGYGAMWLFAQMLMGDTADNIKGLPLIHPELVIKYIPNKAISTNLEIIANPDNYTEKKVITAKKKLAEVKPKKCGEVATYNLLKDCTSIKQAYDLVKECYRLCSEIHEFRHWSSNELVPYTKVIVSELQLLFMRRSEDVYDCIHFLREHTS